MSFGNKDPTILGASAVHIALVDPSLYFMIVISKISFPFQKFSEIIFSDSSCHIKKETQPTVSQNKKIVYVF